MMNTDFLDAQERHWADAELLYSQQRWANADHLYGMAAECGLKRLMLLFGMPFDVAGDRPSDRDDKVHADGIWTRYETYRSGHRNGPGYALALSDPFTNWHIGQRYAHQSHFDPAHVDPHRQGAEHVGQLVKKAIMDGLI